MKHELKTSRSGCLKGPLLGFQLLFFSSNQTQITKGVKNSILIALQKRIGSYIFPMSQLKHQLYFQNIHWIADLVKIRLDFGYLLIFSWFNLEFNLKTRQSNRKKLFWTSNFMKNSLIVLIFFDSLFLLPRGFFGENFRLSWKP